MMLRPLVVFSSMFVAVAAGADAPPSPSLATVCSRANRTCATLAGDHRSALIWRKGAGGKRLPLWKTPVDSPRISVADNGRSLVEIYPGLTLLDRSAGPDTVVLVFHRPRAIPVRVRLSEVVARPAQLPKTISHRQWARGYGFDDTGSFVLDTVEGRHIRFDPATGKRQ
ncbi:hypothetical protein [Sphingomonas sp.]|uniref:hypothetical protein n=1 Tax=Sphingomonas sp. TaxID=28214 RepID=UPI003B3A1609